MKVNKSGRCHDQPQPQPLMSGLDFHVIYIFCLHRAFYKIHPWKLFVYGKIFAHRKIKRGRKSMIKKTQNK